MPAHPIPITSGTEAKPTTRGSRLYAVVDPAGGTAVHFCTRDGDILAVWRRQQGDERPFNLADDLLELPYDNAVLTALKTYQGYLWRQEGTRIRLPGTAAAHRAAPDEIWAMPDKLTEGFATNSPPDRLATSMPDHRPAVILGRN